MRQEKVRTDENEHKAEAFSYALASTVKEKDDSFLCGLCVSRVTPLRDGWYIFTHPSFPSRNGPVALMDIHQFVIKQKTAMGVPIGGFHHRIK